MTMMAKEKIIDARAFFVLLPWSTADAAVPSWHFNIPDVILQKGNSS